MNRNIDQYAAPEADNSAAMLGVSVSDVNPTVSTSGSFMQPSGAHFEQYTKKYRELSNEYKVGDPIGRGGCAVVLEAWRLSDNMHVVIKVITISAGFDEKEAHVAIARFMREAELISSLHEKHIVQCVDYGCFQGTPCMVLEFVDGISLDKLIEKYGSDGISLEYATGIIRQLLSALVETHSKKIIHRDIKPSNIMVFDSPPPFKIRVLDFGISSVQDGLQSQTLMTQQGNVRGTPSYMAPELFTGDTHASVESDLYAVGLVYIECLTSEIAFNDKSFMRVAYKQVNEPLEIPSRIPKCIADIIFRLCEKKVEDRYHSAQNVIDDIDACLEQALKEEEKCTQEWEKSKKKVKHAKNSQQITQSHWYSGKNGIRNVAIIVVLVLLLIGGLVFLFSNASEPVAPQVPDTSKKDLENEQMKRQLAVGEAVDKIKDSWNAASNELNENVRKEEEANKKSAEVKHNANNQNGKNTKKTSKNNNNNKQPAPQNGPRISDSKIKIPF